MMEIWTPLAGYEDLYYVSNLGNIQNKRTGKILKQYMSNNGYMKVCLVKDKKKKNHLMIAKGDNVEERERDIKDMRAELHNLLSGK